MILSARVAVGALVAAVVLIAGFLVVYPGGRKVGGDFRLFRQDAGIYKLQDTRQPENQMGNQGAVVRIGWDEHHILVQRLASPTKGTPWSNEAGWVMVDLDRKIVSPTMTDAELRQRADLSQIVTYSPDSAYEKGHWW